MTYLIQETFITNGKQEMFGSFFENKENALTYMQEKKNILKQNFGFNSNINEENNFFSIFDKIELDYIEFELILINN